MKKRLITSALPYVNNIPHLGNLIQVLSADVFARFCRLAGYETLYVCGTDEYGTATETKALEEGITPKELCDRYYALHTEIYEWFNIAFDKWGRTSTPQHTEITQHIFTKLDENGYINRQTIEQLFCASCSRYLADRYVRGTCPHCAYEEARGDQCENCGKLLDPTDLIEPKCGTCAATPELRQTEHLYINLPAIKPKLELWMGIASEEGFWARNAMQMTHAWIRDGLHERGITRDLTWGIPVPKQDFEKKVFYVWFDAPIGYISITATHTDAWEDWWRDPDNTELYQFIGKDNIPFHTVVFPSSLLGTGETWTMLHHMSSTEYLNYENGKFSKSKGVGVFGNDAIDTGIPADVWRFYIFYNRPEKADSQFTWRDFQEKVNSELIGNLANFVNRTLTFIDRYFDGQVPDVALDETLWTVVRDHETGITNHLERAELRDAFRGVFALSSIANKRFQDGEPWRTRIDDPDAAAALIGNLAFLIRDLSILLSPFIPGTADTIAGFLNVEHRQWSDLASKRKLGKIEKPHILFTRLEDDVIADLRERFSGTQEERKQEAPEPALTTRFAETVELRVAKITSIERHPKADKLYVEQIDLGTEQRQIVSGLVPYYEPSELEGKHIIVVANLKPAKLRGEMSQGMLLAAEADGDIEVLFVDDASPGDRVQLAGFETNVEASVETNVDAGATSAAVIDEISIDAFFELPIGVKNFVVGVDEVELVVAGKTVRTSKVTNGSVG